VGLTPYLSAPIVPAPLAAVAPELDLWHGDDVLAREVHHLRGRPSLGSVSTRRDLSSSNGAPMPFRPVRSWNTARPSRN
jgi:hypothetical protein